MIRISLIVAIVLSLAAGVVNFTVIKGKIDVLTQDRNDQRSAKETAQHQLSDTKKTLAKTQDDLTKTQGDLATSQAAEQKDRDDLVKAQTQVSDLNDKLAKTSQERDDAQGQLAAYRATGLSAQQVASLNTTLQKDQLALDVANQEKIVLSHTVASLTSKLNEVLGVSPFVILPAGLRGTVMAVDPKWNFVVLNVGEDQGVLSDGEMLVSRDGKLVAKVIVRSVQKNRSIANIVPGWQLGDVIEGDEVIPAHPAS